mmetsp:Transcript_26306/g.69132  ORF Transcript_26306/g.69132 Transcript_26306/m.69132 type:complete len:280 (+) Transcript_26306:220-1059(+)
MSAAADKPVDVTNKECAPGLGKVAPRVRAASGASERMARRGHRRSSSAPTFLNTFNRNLAPLEEEEDVATDDAGGAESPKDKSLHWLNVAQIKRQRELQRLSPLNRSGWQLDDSLVRTRSTETEMPTSPHPLDDPTTSTPPEAQAGPAASEEGGGQLVVATGEGGGADALDVPVESRVRSWSLDSQRRPSASTMSTLSSVTSRRSTDASVVSALSAARPSSADGGLGRTRGIMRVRKSMSDEHLEKKQVLFNMGEGELYRPDSCEGLAEKVVAKSRNGD